MITNILVPVDGSDGSDRAVTQAIEIAKICDAKLNFLYVANINQLAINAALTNAIIDAVKKAGNIILDRAVNMVPTEIMRFILKPAHLPQLFWILKSSCKPI